MKKLLILVAVFVSFMQILSAQKLVTGTVVEADNGTPIPGVNVTIEGMVTVGTITDLDGSYSIQVPDNAAVLIFQFVGKQTTKETVGDRNVIDVQLENSDNELGELIVTGYKVVSRGEITGSVQVIDNKRLDQIPSANFQQVLSGQAAGVSSYTSSGRPGAGTTIRIRGTNSISLSGSPLYIIDGVPVDDSHISAINPNDIAQLSILKDASATSIYGARAANGVILITTKKGENSDKAQITFRSQFGISKVIQTRDIDLLSSEELLNFQEKYYSDTWKGPGKTWEEFYQEKFHKSKAELLQINTDWREEILRDNQPIQSYELSARGGNKTSNYYISGGYYDQKGIYHGSDFKRYSLRLNYENSSLNRLSFGTNIYGGFTKENNTVTRDDGAVGEYISNAYAGAHYIAPYIPFYGEDGWYSTTRDGLSWAHPLDRVYNKDDYKNELKLLGSVFAEVKILEGLKFKSTVGGEYWSKVRTRWTNPFGPEGSGTGGQSSKQYDSRFKLINTNLLTYVHTFNGVHNLTAILGHEVMFYKRNGFDITAKSVPTDQIKTLNAFAENTSYGGDGTEYRVLSYFANASYNYDSKYYLEGTYRLDGCSRFGENNRFAGFYSIGASWNIKNEEFLRTVDVISEMRLSSSYGTSGNYGTDNGGLGNFEHMALYNFSSKYNGVSASSRSSLGNPNLSWETVSKANVAISVGLLNKYNIEVELYHNVTSDMLYNVPLSRTTGFSSLRDNVCSMKNDGIELSLRANLLNINDIYWNINANFAYNKNEITDLLGEEVINGGYDYTILKEGVPYGTFYLPKFAGINPATGDRVFYTKDGQLTEDFNTAELSQVLNKSYIAPYFGGVSTDITYKGITLFVHCSWAYKKYLFNDTRNIFTITSIYQDANKISEVLTAWDQVGDITAIASPFRGKSSNQGSTDQFLEDASYFKIKNISLSYTLPALWSQKVKLSSVRVYVQADNIFTFTKYRGIDPEFSYPGGTDIFPYPNIRTYTFGFDIGI